MSLSILNNISSLQAQNSLNMTATSLNKTLQQLSTGQRINSGADDAAGLAIANGLQANVTALTQSVTVDLQSITSENKDLQDQINNFQTYLADQKTLLTAEYSQADMTLQEIPQLQAQINAELGYSPTTKS
jgi:flagellin